MKGRKKNDSLEKRAIQLQFLLTRFLCQICSIMLFRAISILFFLPFTLPLLGQNHWDNILPIKAENKTYLVFGENVNIRKDSSLKSEVIAKLQPGDPVKIIKQTNILLAQGLTKEYWYEIQTGDKKGFVWGSLLADGVTEIGGFQLLIRNPGANTKKIEFKLLKGGKLVSSLTLSPGPVANEDWKFTFYKGEVFSPNPGFLIGFRYLVYSEIEYGQQEETILRITENGKIGEFFSWNPGACDPPSCMDTWILFPGDILAKDPSIGRKEYKSQTNTILEITRSYDLDDESINEYSVSMKKWNGKKLQDIK